MSPRPLPRDVSADQLIKALRRMGYEIIRQDGSHIRLRTVADGKNHVTVPQHNPIRVGTLNKILTGIAIHHHLTRDELLSKIEL